MIVMESGERLPALLDGATGLPIFQPMAYVLSEVRARGRAANTIIAHLSAIELLLVHALSDNIDLAERIAPAVSSTSTRSRGWLRSAG
jgi:hypothetical protein